MAENMRIIIEDWLHYETRYKILICQKCGFGIDSKYYKNHVHKIHGKKGDELKSIIDLIKPLDLVSTKEIPRPQHFKYYNKYLKLTPPEYFACDKCNHVEKAEKAMKQHYNKIHNIKFSDRNEPKPYFKDLKGQSFFEHPNKKIFIPNIPHNNRTTNQLTIRTNTSPDNENPNTENNQELNDDFINEYNAILTRNEETTEFLFTEEDQRFTHPFLLTFRWNIFLMNKDLNFLCNLIQTPKKEEIAHYFIYKSVKNMWFLNHQEINRLDRSILQIINTEKFEEFQSKYKQKPFKQLQTKSSRDRYSSFLAEFFVFLYNIWKNQYFDNVFPKVNNAMEEALQSIDDIINTNNLEIDEDNIYIENDIYNIYLEIMGQNLTQSSSAKNPKFENYFILYCVLKSFNNQTNALRDLKNLTNIFSGIIYNLKLFLIGMGLYKERKADINNETFNLHAWIEHKHKKFLNIDSFTCYSEIEQLRAYTRVIGKKNITEPRIQDINENTIKIDDMEIHINETVNLIQYLYNQCETLLYNELIYISPNELHNKIKLSNLTDNINESARGYFFGKHHENNLAIYQDFLARKLGNINTELGKEFTICVDNKIKFKPTKIQQWKRVRMQFLKNLLLIIYLTSGSPNRGTEILTVAWQNSAQLKRSVLIDKNTHLIMILTGYSKTTSGSGQLKPTLRFVADKIGQLLVDYLIIALPFYNYLNITTLSTEDDPYTKSDLVFENNGKIFRENTISNLLKLNFATHLNISLTSNPFRHAWKYIIKSRIIKKFDLTVYDSDFEPSDHDSDSEEENTVDNLFHKTMGHSRNTALMNYARPDYLPAMTIENNYDTLLKLCKRIHKFFGVHEKININNLNKHSRQISDLNNQIYNKRVRSSGNLMEKFNNLEIQYQKNPILNNEELLKFLRQFLKDDKANFTSPNQLNAIRACVNNDPSIIYIDATGAGKSLIFMLPVFIDASKYHLVFSPLLALKYDMLKNAKDRGLNAAIWEQSKDKIEKLLIITYDTLITADFKTWINNKIKNKEIARIYIDEAHTIITHRNFRYIMKHFTEINLFKLPLIFLTATFPKEIEYLLYQEMKIDNKSMIIRNSTARKNIKYMIYKQPDQNFNDKEYIQSFINNLRTRKLMVSTDKTIIFINNKQACEHLAKKLNCDYYHSDVPNKEEIIKNFGTNPNKLILIGTSSIELGINILNVRLTIYIGVQLDLASFIQGSGRAGRDGKLSFSLLIYQDWWFRNKEISYEFDINTIDFNNYDKIQISNMHKYIYARNCRRIILNEIFDNEISTECDINNDIIMCDLCEKRSNIIEQKFEQTAITKTEILKEKTEFSVKISNLQSICFFCLYCNNYDDLYQHSFWECNVFIKNKNLKKLRDDMCRTIKYFKKNIRNNKSIAEGFARYCCYMPSNICDGNECIYQDIVIELVVMFKYFIRENKYAFNNIGKNVNDMNNDTYLDLAIKKSEIFKTDCIKAINWIQEFNLEKYMELSVNSDNLIDDCPDYREAISQLFDKLRELNRICIYCLWSQDYSAMYDHGYEDCDIKAEYKQNFDDWVVEIKSNLNNKPIQNCCSKCYMPLFICPDKECEFENLLIDVGVFIQLGKRENPTWFNHFPYINKYNCGPTFMQSTILYNEYSVKSLDWINNFDLSQFLEDNPEPEEVDSD